MPEFLVTISRHHNTDHPSYSSIIEVADLPTAELKALRQTVQDEFFVVGTDEQFALAYNAAVKHGEASLELVEEELGGDVDDPYTTLFAVWHINDGQRNFGFGVSDDGTSKGTDKYENRWIAVEPYVPDADLKAKLEAMSKEELVDALLRAAATGSTRTIFRD
jgi:hypothetical protein